jgi:MOSC domain-containing protein YiiM
VLEMEVLEALARNDPPIQSGSIRIEPIDHRRNLTVRGVPLNHLVGQRFGVGAALAWVRPRPTKKYLRMKLPSRP